MSCPGKKGGMLRRTHANNMTSAMLLCSARCIIHRAKKVRVFQREPLVFLVVQLLTRIPLIAVLEATVLAHLLRTSTAFPWIWLVILAITAGLFEEVGRYVGSRLASRAGSQRSGRKR